MVKKVRERLDFKNELQWLHLLSYTFTKFSPALTIPATLLRDVAFDKFHYRRIKRRTALTKPSVLSTKAVLDALQDTDVSHIHKNQSSFFDTNLESKVIS